MNSEGAQTRPGRPIGLILAALVLGLFALGTLLSGAFTFVAAFIVPHQALANAPGATAPPNPQLIGIMLGVIGIIELLIAAWAIFTIVGLLRLRSWARYSILIIGSLLAFFGIASAGMLALLPAIMAQTATQTAAQTSLQTPLPPHLMQGLLLTLGLFYTAIASVGVWWLVYFNRRSVKAYFLPTYAAQPNPYAYSTAASLATPGGLGDPFLPVLPLPPPPAGRFTHIPTSIKIIAILFFVSALGTAVFTFLPFPAFLAGFYLSGFAGHLLYFGYTLLMLLIGLGLLRLDNRARLGVYLLTALAVVNTAVMLTPWGRARFAAYNHTLQQQMHLPNTSALIDPASPVVILPGLVFALLFYGVVLLLIERHRTLFEHPPTS